MKKTMGFVLGVVLLVGWTARSEGLEPSRFHVPKILIRTAAALKVTRTSRKLADKTYRTLSNAVAAINWNAQQSPKFYALIDTLVNQMSAGGFPPGFLWKRFLKESRISTDSAGLPALKNIGSQKDKLISIPMNRYDYMLNLMMPYLARKTFGNSRREERYGRVMIRLAMENLFATYLEAVGVAHYSKKRLLGKPMRKWWISNPIVWVVAHNSKLRHLFRSYYQGLNRTNYYSVTPTYKVMQGLIDRNDNKFPYSAVRRILSGFTGLRKLIGNEQYHNCWSIANILWQFLCLARARKNNRAILQIRSYIRSWRSHTNRWYLRRWLSEALSVHHRQQSQPDIRVHIGQRRDGEQFAAAAAVVAIPTR